MRLLGRWAQAAALSPRRHIPRANDLGHAIFTRTRVRSFAFDIEVLFLARKLGARIVELPVSTTYRAESTFSIRKHLPRFLRDIVQIRLNDLAGRYRA